MFNKVFIENDLGDYKETKELLSKIKYKELVQINRFDDVFEKVKKPYLQKRKNLNLFLAKKRGQIVKEAPDAYGLSDSKHYYFVHAYNCIYECEYCYLQGYFNSPDLVWFINHDEIINEIDNVSKRNPGAWFHAGEFSDSLALSHFTNEIPKYHRYFKNNKTAKLELRTKSANIKSIENLEPIENMFITFSLSPDDMAKKIDRKASPIKHRLLSIQKLDELGFKIGIHLDPIVLSDDWKNSYQKLISDLSLHIELGHISFFSIGVVRFTKDVFHTFSTNYPDSLIKTSSFIKSFDNKVRYPRPVRKNALRFVKESLIHYGANESKIYECME
jgi:spore photoproduct lyase